MVNAVAILYLVTGLLNLACAAIVLVGGSLLAQGVDPAARPVIGGIAGIVAVVVILLGVPDLLAAHAIWNRRYWGYVLGLVLAAINALWALASIVWGDVCSLFVCGSCSIFAFVVLCNSRYASEFS
jgi:hypothetical protein